MWKAAVAIANNLLQREAVLILLAGAALIICGASEGIPFTQITVPRPLPLLIIGFVLVGTGVTLVVRHAFYPANPQLQKIDPAEFGVKIESPKDRDFVDAEYFTMSGVFQKALPNHYTVEILERDLGQGNYRWRGTATIFNHVNTWQARVWCGDESGKERIYSVVIAGPSAQALFLYYDIVGKRYQFKSRPGISRLTEDVYHCDQIRVVRR
jgi:hypothetical protein